MDFKKFCEYLERLEKVSSRLVMTDILVELLRELDKDEVDKGVYLMLGGLAPKFARIEFNLAEKQVMKAVARGTEMDLEKIKGLYKEEGDLGEVVQKLKKIENFKTKSLEEIYEELKGIALEGGMGSQERKLDRLASLLSQVSGVEAKYIVRIILSKLRLGFSDKTILDAVSVMESGDKSGRKQLDSIYQIYPDVGKLVKGVKQGSLKKIKPTIGVPILPALCQRLNSAAEIIAKMGEVAVEPKIDGTRVQIHYSGGEIRTFTRNLDENSKMFSELAEIGSTLNAKSVILDCEAIGVDKKTGKFLPFQMTITRKRKHGIGAAALEVPLQFYVFDILYKDGVSLIEESYEKRRKILQETIKENKILVVDDYVRTDEASRVHELHEKFLREGLEGAVIKKWDGKYLPGRQGWNWVKIKEAEGTSGKLADTLDLVVMGYYKGRGKRAGFGVGAFLVGIRDGESIKTIAKIGTGLTDERFRELKQRLNELVADKKPKEYGEVGKSLVPDGWVLPKLVVEIAADEVTKSPAHSSGFALRFPRLIKFRDDKDLGGVTDLREIEEMV